VDRLRVLHLPERQARQRHAAADLRVVLRLILGRRLQPGAVRGLRRHPAPAGGGRAPAREIRERQEREAAEAARKLKFERDKAEAVRSLKGVSTGEVRLKGVDSNPHGLKGIDGGPALKGLDAPRVVEEAEDKPKACRVVDECADALQGQADALDAARKDQADLYLAMGSADMMKALGDLESAGRESLTEKAKEAVFGRDKERPEFYVWRGKDQAGLPTYLRDYKATVDDVFDHMDKKRVAALNGKYDPEKKTLLQSEGGKLVAQDLKAKYETYKGLTDKMLRFRRYMADLQKCAQGPDAAFNGCVKQMTKLYESTLGDLPMQEATRARIQAASSAYLKYTTKALERAKAAAASASKCFKGCR
jgi:hypothetical protein